MPAESKMIKKLKKIFVKNIKKTRIQKQQSTEIFFCTFKPLKRKKVYLC